MMRRQQNDRFPAAEQDPQLLVARLDMLLHFLPSAEARRPYPWPLL